MKLLTFLVCLAVITTSKASMDVKVILHNRNGDRTEHKGDTCDSGLLFDDHQEFSCACVTGVWAFYGIWCTQPELIIAGSNFCFQMPKGKTSQISLLSSSKFMFTSTLARMTPGLEQLKEKVYEDATVDWDMSRAGFVTTGEDSWELQTAAGKSYCLRTTYDLDSYCSFVEFPEELRKTNVTKVKRGCSSADFITLKPFECPRYYRGSYGDERVCAEIEREQLESSTRPTSYDSFEDSQNYGKEDTDLEFAIQGAVKRYKRQAPGNGTANSTGAVPPPPPGPGNGSLPTPTGNGTPVAAAAAVPPGPPPPPNPGPIDDEDWVDPAQSSVINHPLILAQLRAYLDAEISGSAGTATVYKANTRGIPAFLLLEKAMEIMQKTCTVVKPDYFKLAFNAFTNIQVQSYHVKEPYLSQPAYERILGALNDCFMAATRYNFVNQTMAPNITTNGTENGTMSAINDTNTCEAVVLPQASNMTMQGDRTFNLSIEDDKRGRGYEPIVETVWKIFLNAHSYCYKQFSDYYNDHHSFSVALLSLFTNEIQNIWFNTSFPNGTFVEAAPGLLHYGGIIGPHRPLIDNIDLCVAASRIGSPYPWLMNRPPLDTTNKWVRRRRRSLSAGPSCLKTPKSTRTLYTEMGFGRCD